MLLYSASLQSQDSPKVGAEATAEAVAEIADAHAISQAANASANTSTISLATTTHTVVLKSKFLAQEPAAKLYLSIIKYKNADMYQSTTVLHAADHVASTTKCATIKLADDTSVSLSALTAQATTGSASAATQVAASLAAALNGN